MKKRIEVTDAIAERVCAAVRKWYEGKKRYPHFPQGKRLIAFQEKNGAPVWVYEGIIERFTELER